MATARTTDPQAKAVRSARTRNLTAAKRSLGILADEVTAHRKALENGEVPDSGFLAVAIKYETARSVLAALGALSAPGSDETAPVIADPVEVSQSDLEALVRYVVSDVISKGGVVQAGTPLEHLIRAAYPGGLGPSEMGAAAPVQDGAPG